MSTRPRSPALEAPREDSRHAERGVVSRELVIEAALVTIQAGKYGSMTMRSLAAQLGVAPMTLYRHVRDRDDLLDEVADRLLALTWRPQDDFERWQDWIVDSGKRLRRLLVDQPAVLHVYLSHPVTTPVALERMAAVQGVLLDAGFDENGAQRIYATLHTYTVGFAALEASRAAWNAREATLDATLQHLATFTTSEQYVVGLKTLLAGVEHTAHREVRGTSSS